MSKRLITQSIGSYLNLISYLVPNYTAKKTLEIFAKVRKGKLQSNVKIELLERGKSEQISCAGHQIQTYHWPGEGKKILLLHGWESNTNRWRNLIPKLESENYDIYAIDAPAHGYSSGTHHYLTNYAEAAATIIRMHQIEVVIGHSMGGMAMLYAISHFSLGPISHLISLGAPTDFSLIVAGYQKTLGFNTRVLGLLDQLIQKEIGTGIEDFSTAKFSYPPLGKFLILHDRFDGTIPATQAQKLHKHISSELYITEGFGHSMHQKEVCEKIIQFLKQ